MGALFNLVGQCGVSKPTMNAGDVCANVDGFCGPNRNSDPRVCLAAQTLVRASQSFCLEDPCGIRIRRLDGSGLWKVDGVTVDINDETANKGVWKVTRNGRRGFVSFHTNVTFAGAPIRTGAQLSGLLVVGADVLHAADAALPPWSRVGHEDLRSIVA